MSVEIRQRQPGKNLHDFMRVPYVVLASDPVWVPPLDHMVRDQLTPGKNPFFDHAEAALFTAYRHGVPVGRISAQIDREHLKRYADDVGFFGFFDTVDDLEVAQALMHAARTWLGARGVRRMRGPLSFSMNEEVGVLIEGFDTPPMVRMGHHQRYQSSLIEVCGLNKIKDLYAWRYRLAELPEHAQRARADIAAVPGVKLRSVNRANLDGELVEMLQIRDDAWRDTWGHVSLTKAEARAAAETLRPWVDPELALIAEVEGRPAAVAMALPNLNELIGDLQGKLLPLGWAKLRYRLRMQLAKGGRLWLLGVKRAVRRQQRYAGLALALLAELYMRSQRLGYEQAELSWTLEDNAEVNSLISSLSAEVYKKYRLYEQPI